MKIECFDELLAPALGKDKVVKSYTAYNLIGPGENYGSVMLGVDVKIGDKTNGDEEEELHLVAKMCPPTEFIMKMFNIPVTFKKEVGFYSTVIPTLQEFQRERGCEEVVDFVPKYFGSRFNLNPNSEDIDKEACLLLENIKVQGYDIGVRRAGFDVETAKYLIKDLAVFHAVPIALKMVHPKRFEEKIQPYLVKHVTEETFSEDMCLALITATLDVTKRNLEYHKYLDRMEERMLVNAKNFKDLCPTGKEPFATIIHNDFWVNNTMLKYENGKPVGNKIVDFQLVNYGSPGNDIIFFIYTSLNNDIIAEHYETLIDLYYDTFISTLKSLGVDTGCFGYDAFLAELEGAAKDREFFHIMFMLKPIYAEKDKAKDLSDLNEDELLEMDSLSDLFYERMFFVIEDFADKGWL